MGKGKVIFIRNAALMTATSLSLRLVGMFFRVWLASHIGAEGMGLYQQIFSLYALVSVFATSGVGLAVTRLVSEELTLGRRHGVDMIIARSITVTSGIAIVSSLAVALLANPVSVYIMSDTRAIPSLRIMSLSLPFMGISAVFKGYFFARKKAGWNSLSQIFEQALRTGFTVAVFSLCKADTASGAAAVFGGDSLAEAGSAIFLAIGFFADRKKLSVTGGRSRPPRGIIKNLLRIVTPIASGKYLNSLLRTVENILVPSRLVAAGMTRPAALSGFGAVKGMALPLLLFPAGLLSSVTSLLIPEMSEAVAAGRKDRIKSAAERSIALTFMSSIPIAVIFYFAAEPLSLLIYNDAEVGESVKILSLLVPLMYIDSVSDALLKALDRQVATFRHALLDSIGRILLITVLLPRLGMMGFFAVMYLSNLFTALLNLRMLLRVTGAKMRVKTGLLMPLFLSVTAGLLAECIGGALRLNGVVYIMLVAALVLLSETPLLSAFKKIYRG